MAKKAALKAGTPAPATAPEDGRSNSELVREILDSGILKPAEIARVALERYQKVVSKPLINQVKMGWKKKQQAGGAAKFVSKIRRPQAEAAPEPRAAKDISPVDATVMLCEAFGTDKARRIIDSLMHK